MKHGDEALRLLKKQVSNVHEAEEIRTTAQSVMAKWVDPASGGKEEINGLIYGLVQSGKTGVLTVTAAMGADEGYKTIVILTSDNDPLYEQTLSRARAAFPGMDILGKKDLHDSAGFISRIRRNTCAIVITKNSGILSKLVGNLREGKVRGLSCLLIDDEADQASLNTLASRGAGQASPINDRIEQLRNFFQKNTYLQVTATPQALFLQTPGHRFRPAFTVLSHPGADYVGGNDFFSPGSELIRTINPQDIVSLAPGAQPRPSLDIPASLMRALDVFMVAATFKRMKDVDENCAFLCHVSTRKADHNHIVALLHRYKSDLAASLAKRRESVVKRLRVAFDDLAATHKELGRSSFDDLLSQIQFLSLGITVKLVNGETDEGVALDSPYNLFVGGNKLGRGVTIKNLLVSYYGRNPRSPQADTVLQHARMYGYRRKDKGLLRLFLPPQLLAVFQAIHQMEQRLRELIATNPDEEFRGLYLEGGLNPTRRNVLAPGALGYYTGGTSYNPAQVMREPSVAGATTSVDKLVSNIANKAFAEVPLATIQKILKLIQPDLSQAEQVWNTNAISESLAQYARVQGTSPAEDAKGYIYVDRDRGVRERRHETQGILEGGEAARIPADRPTLFLLRTKPSAGETASWWPQVRFPNGRYAFAFAI